MATKGTLVCVGCGIKGVAHLTLETVGWIRSADVVCCVCSDPATNVWIRQQAACVEDLAACYTEIQDRTQIYDQMIAIILMHVRLGKVVCVVFYGHPGVFVYPTHAAIAKAREEGHSATMLPGVCAADCLFADIGIDPSQTGCLMYEATDLLLRRRTISPDSHLIVWQIGAVGNSGFRFAGYDNRENVRRVVEYLAADYGEEHRVCHYQAAQFPVCDPLIEWVRLGALADACRVSAISTLYLPPRVRREADVAVGQAIGYFREAPAAEGRPAYAVPAPAAPRTYVPPPSVSALADLINRMAADPQLLMRFRQAPEQFLSHEAQLEAEDIRALLSRESGKLRVAIKRTPVGSAS
jgi:hypothetical protein